VEQLRARIAVSEAQNRRAVPVVEVEAAERLKEVEEEETSSLDEVAALEEQIQVLPPLLPHCRLDLPSKWLFEYA
jgi:hypothetical protein